MIIFCPSSLGNVYDKRQHTMQTWDEHGFKGETTLNFSPFDPVERCLTMIGKKDMPVTLAAQHIQILALGMGNDQQRACMDQYGAQGLRQAHGVKCAKTFIKNNQIRLLEDGARDVESAALAM